MKDSFIQTTWANSGYVSTSGLAWFATGLAGPLSFAPTPSCDLDSINRAVERYFEHLGYRVGMDSSSKLGKSWHEIKDDDGLVCQIDMGVDISDIIKDMTAWSKGEAASSSSPDYTVSYDQGDPRFDALLKKVAANPNPKVGEQIGLVLA